MRARVPDIASTADMGILPIIGDFHYNVHLLLAKYPAAAKHSPNPLNPVTSATTAVRNFPPSSRASTTITSRIGVIGFADQDLFTTLRRDWRAFERDGEEFTSSECSYALRSAATRKSGPESRPHIFAKGRSSGLARGYRQLAARCATAAPGVT